jgi:DNA-binding Lrp family transcriptional regulator
MGFENEIALLSIVRKNARKSLTEISRELDLPLTTIHDMVNRLESKNIIRGYTIVVNFFKTNFKIRAAMILKAKDKEGLLRFLSAHPNVNTILKVANNYDFMVEVLFKDLLEYERFKEEISHFDTVEKNEIHILETKKYEESVPGNMVFQRS